MALIQIRRPLDTYQKAVFPGMLHTHVAERSLASKTVFWHAAHDAEGFLISKTVFSRHAACEADIRAINRPSAFTIATCEEAEIHIYEEVS